MGCGLWINGDLDATEGRRENQIARGGLDSGDRRESASCPDHLSEGAWICYGLDIMNERSESGRDI